MGRLLPAALHGHVKTIAAGKPDHPADPVKAWKNYKSEPLQIYFPGHRIALVALLMEVRSFVVGFYMVTMPGLHASSTS